MKSCPKPYLASMTLSSSLHLLHGFPSTSFYTAASLLSLVPLIDTEAPQLPCMHVTAPKLQVPESHYSLGSDPIFLGKSLIVSPGAS